MPSARRLLDRNLCILPIMSCRSLPTPTTSPSSEWTTLSDNSSQTSLHNSGILPTQSTPERQQEDLDQDTCCTPTLTKSRPLNQPLASRRASLDPSNITTFSVLSEPLKDEPADTDRCTAIVQALKAPLYETLVSIPPAIVYRWRLNPE